MKKKLNLSNILFVVFIVLLLVPQTGKPIQVALHKAKLYLFSPTILAEEHQNQITPFNYKLATLDGSLANIKIGKGKITFLSYWATWCPPCIAEMSSIQLLYDDYKESIDFVLLTNEEPEVITAFLEKKGYQLPVFIPQIKAPELLYSTSIPTNYIIDQEGKIIIREKGASDWNSDKVRLTLDALLE